MNISNSNLLHNHIGLELINSPSFVSNCNISNNGIDIFSEKTSIQLIDSIVQNIFIDGINQIIRTQPVSINFNPFRLKAQAQEIINTKEPITKRKKFIELLNKSWNVAKNVSTLYNMMKIVLKLYGIDLP